MLMNLETLNRLRVNAGKAELKSWKASGAKLQEAITALTDAGVTDALPGANVNVEPVTDDPVIAQVLPKKAEPQEIPEPPADMEILDNAMDAVKDKVQQMKDTHAKIAEEMKTVTPVTNGEAKLGRGLETEPMARQSRMAVQMKKERDAADAKAAKKAAKAEAKELHKIEKAAAKSNKKKDKKKDKKIAGEVDAKKEPEKAARQKKHIEEKQAARAAKKATAPKVEKDPNEITVADIARELDIDPKVARAKLRRHEEEINKLHTKGQDRWTFPKSAKATIVKILK